MADLSKKQLAARAYHAKHKERINAQKRAAYAPAQKTRHVFPSAAIAASTGTAKRSAKSVTKTKETPPKHRLLSVRERLENLKMDMELAAELSEAYF